MQAGGEHLSDDHDRVLESAAKISEDLKVSLRINEESQPSSTIFQKDRTQYYHDHDNGVSSSTILHRKRIHDHDKDIDVDVYVDAQENEDEEEEEFSFMCEETSTSPIAAEDAFLNGQIRPNFTFFTGSNRENNLLTSGDEQLPTKPQVKKVFVEMKDDHQKMTLGSSENDVIVGPYCDWSKKTVVEASVTPSEACKKSNSTGFSKLWKFKEFRNRSNSDGRDAFVFLNNNATTSSGGGGGGGEAKVNGGKVNDGKGKVKKGGKGKTATVSAHEVYMRNKAKEDDRRRSYLPYRPEVFGFFTNVNGGMSKNVHPF